MKLIALLESYYFREIRDIAWLHSKLGDLAATRKEVADTLFISCTSCVGNT